jgi:SSS family solute:Na+ symporter
MSIYPSFGILDYLVFIIFFLGLIVIAKISSIRVTNEEKDYYLNRRELNLFFYVLTTVATWYGGILGAGEFSYRYGISSWFTQGLPYYIFAILFALLLAKKVRKASIYTIPEIVEKNYSPNLSILVAFILLIIVSPAPYIFMIASLIYHIFKINLFWATIISLLFSSFFIYKGGFKTNIWTDSYEFFVMFLGFILIVIVSFINFGGYDYLNNNLPKGHLSLTGDLPVGYIIVWYLIALWTFADPGFHQRASAAKNEKVAVYGIFISVIFWFLFDFLTTTTGLYAKATIPNLTNPVLAYPIYAEKILGDGLKGIFYVAMFATILSTSNSFIFLSLSIINKDILEKIEITKNLSLRSKSIISLSIISFFTLIITTLIPSVIDMWYTIGTIFLPGVIAIIISCYYPKFSLNTNDASKTIYLSIIVAIIWYLIKIYFIKSDIEPMLIGLLVPFAFYIKNKLLKN